MNEVHCFTDVLYRNLDVKLKSTKKKMGMKSHNTSQLKTLLIDESKNINVNANTKRSCINANAINKNNNNICFALWK